MALLDLLFDTLNKKLVASLNDLDEVSLPTFRQEDGISIELTVVKKISGVRRPFYEVINVSGYSLQISVGTTPGTVLASQNSWTVDASSGKFTGTLPLNTSEMNALADGTAILVEIRLFDGTYYYGKRFGTTFQKAIATVGSPQVIAGDTALGSLEADRTYLRKEGRPGEGFILQSQDETKKVLIYLHNDGSVREESIT